MNFWMKLLAVAWSWVTSSRWREILRWHLPDYWLLLSEDLKWTWESQPSSKVVKPQWLFTSFHLRFLSSQAGGAASFAMVWKMLSASWASSSKAKPGTQMHGTWHRSLRENSVERGETIRKPFRQKDQTFWSDLICLVVEFMKIWNFTRLFFDFMMFFMDFWAPGRPWRRRLPRLRPASVKTCKATVPFPLCRRRAKVHSHLQKPFRKSGKSGFFPILFSRFQRCNEMQWDACVFFSIFHLFRQTDAHLDSFSGSSCCVKA